MSLIGACVLDNYGEEDEDKCSDDCCCFTRVSKGVLHEKCRAYRLDNYTLIALMESGDEKYQHLQNETGHWVRRHSTRVPSTRRHQGLGKRGGFAA